MSNEQAIKLTSEIIRERGAFGGIKFLRSLGISFQTAKTMAFEIKGNAPWYRRASK